VAVRAARHRAYLDNPPHPEYHYPRLAATTPRIAPLWHREDSPRTLLPPSCGAASVGGPPGCGERLISEGTAWVGTEALTRGV